MRSTLVRVNQPVLAGVGVFLLIAVAPTALLWLALRVPAVVEAVAEWRRARRPRPAGPPIETLVVDVRRLRRELRRPARTHVRRTACLQAYDDALLDLCRALEVAPPALDGADRAFSRLQAEAAVEAAGVALDAPPSAGRAA